MSVRKTRPITPAARITSGSGAFFAFETRANVASIEERHDGKPAAEDERSRLGEEPQIVPRTEAVAAPCRPDTSQMGNGERLNAATEDASRRREDAAHCEGAEKNSCTATSSRPGPKRTTQSATTENFY